MQRLSVQMNLVHFTGSSASVSRATGGAGPRGGGGSGSGNIWRAELLKKGADICQEHPVWDVPTEVPVLLSTEAH